MVGGMVIGWMMGGMVVGWCHAPQGAALHVRA